MKRTITAALLALSALIPAACGGGTHANCRDEDATTAYTQKWQSDLTAAIAAGTVDQAKAQRAGEELMKSQADITDLAAFCSRLDDIRADLSF